MATFSESNHHHHNTSDGVPQRVNSPRFSGPMTRRAHSFKRHGAATGNSEVELQINSPRSEEALEPILERKHGHHHHHHHSVTQRTHGGVMKGFLKRPLESIVVDLGLREKKKFGHWMFLLFCGVCFFMGVLKICATGWLGSAIEKAQTNKVN